MDGQELENAYGYGNIKDSVNVTNPDGSQTITIQYAELGKGGSGPGPRGIKVWIEGLRGVRSYKLDPNPHHSREYNKNQEKFYEQVAELIGGIRLNGDWPADDTELGTVPLCHQVYILRSWD